jgi:hypothetical protein
MKENNDLLYKYEIMALFECEGIESVYQDQVRVRTKEEAELKLEIMIDLACALDERVKTVYRSVTLIGLRTQRAAR